MIRKLFRRDRPAPVVPEAELARRLVDPDYCSPNSGEPLRAANGVVRPEAPFSWKNPPEAKEDETFELGYMEMLTDNYARRDGIFFLRAYLPVPLKDTDGQVFIGIWCSLSSGHHARFRSAQARGEADKLGEMSSWLYTQLPRLTGPLLTKGVLVPYSEGRTPFYWITDEKHPFHTAQNEGMSATDILALYESFDCADVVKQIKA